jgi:hypothetical protein
MLSKPTVVSTSSDEITCLDFLSDDIHFINKDNFIAFVKKYNQLLQIADDMYITLINEIGETSASLNYKKHLESSL